MLDTEWLLQITFLQAFSTSKKIFQIQTINQISFATLGAIASVTGTVQCDQNQNFDFEIKIGPFNAVRLF